MEKSPLLEIIGYTFENRILDFLIEGKGLDYTKSDIASGSGISRPTIYKVLKKLARQGVVEKTRKIGRAQLCRLNEKSDRAMFLLKLEEMLLKKSFEDAAEKLAVKTRSSS